MTPRPRKGSALAGGLAVGLLVAGILASSALIASPRGQQAQSRFPHEKHATVFPLCTTCHAGVVEQGESIWPEPRACASCHDGVVEPAITWQPRQGPRPGNRRFAHDTHHRAVTARNPADSTLIRTCSSCHVETGAQRMAVRPAVVGKCLDCHGFTAGHFDLPNDACATCHVRLTDAPSLTREDIARFPKPRSHLAPDFILGGHGRAARAPDGGVASSCATCHSRNLCLACHVNAPESRVIRSLALDDRPAPYLASQPVPASHLTSGFLRTHGRDAQQPTATCANCHARESCTTCHIGVPPRAIAALPPAGPGRAPGALLTRGRPADHGRDFRDKHGPAANARPASCASCHARESCASCHVGNVPRAVAAMPAAVPGRVADAHWKRVPPASHTRDFRERHGPEANARPATCETCHERSSCLECHRPTTGRQTAYHPANFITRHPSSAYAREASCSDCHNPAQFCQSCHQKSGLVAVSRIGRRGYHDAFRGFSLGHGQAARQSLESCASCHAERDCTACHSSVGGGFRFNPHGPGFNPARAAAKNPSTCIACHGRVPGL
ncbi:MAG TPA: hypothetical protein VFO55_05925 [Gemmatimonadaceae bacterium]|nr:hypothetical protein [Gemmatimonadaceae bacterium]